MITTGIVISKNYNSSDSNSLATYMVDIPIFKNAGVSAKLNDTIFECTCAVQSSTYEPYNIGDKVYVGFVNNQFADPVILGKIYQMQVFDSATYQLINSLKVTDKVVLPTDTIIGEVTYKQLTDALHTIEILVNEVQALKDKLNNE